MNSRTYQLSARPNDTNETTKSTSRTRWSGRCRPSSCSMPWPRCSDVPVKFNGYPLGTRAGQLPGVAAMRDREHAARRPPSCSSSRSASRSGC